MNNRKPTFAPTGPSPQTPGTSMQTHVQVGTHLCAKPSAPSRAQGQDVNFTPTDRRAPAALLSSLSICPN